MKKEITQETLERWWVLCSKGKSPFDSDRFDYGEESFDKEDSVYLAGVYDVLSLILTEDEKRIAESRYQASRCLNKKEKGNKTIKDVISIICGYVTKWGDLYKHKNKRNKLSKRTSEIIEDDLKQISDTLYKLFK